ncbi:unnamed protein product [Leptidea sinapis]|uniref:Uncharacterized protein n=1 Tax=Leptidea sinapis TaxID=189913 RepID=A0A5E4QYR2_9NEOP|nr:unnamed protein product [Leptidea sinapis]
MDWCKLLALLVAVVSITTEAEVPKKKIRIHLPQTVKHIHHHKKIYITNHPASSQYAPAYMPSAEGSMAISSSVIPGVPNIMPLSAVNMYSDHKIPTASQLLPLYNTRGYYGPTQSTMEDNEYDITHDLSDSYVPSVYSTPGPNSQRNKKVKVIKVNDQPRKKIAKKGKPKRVPGRHRQPPPPPPPASEVEHPVSTFHEQFYSDLHGTGTIRKIKKPPRVEKIIDGDTEHIHEYTEEHIHKLLYNDNPTRNLVGLNQIPIIPTLGRQTQLFPYKGAHSLLIPANHYTGLAPVAPLTAPAQLEYAAYNPREVTHDHIFHDHGEIPSGVEITKETMSSPPKGSYNVQGIHLGSKLQKGKIHPYKKPIKPVNTDFSYYEGIYSDNRQKKTQRPVVTPTAFGASEEDTASYRSMSDLSYKKENIKLRNQLAALYGKSVNDYRSTSSNPSSPFSVTSKILHDFKGNNYPTSGSGSNASPKYKKDQYESFKDTYASNHPYESYTGTSNLFTSEDKNDAFSFATKNGKKSISTQNLNFEGQEHATFVDHLGNEALIDDLINDNSPTALGDMDQYDHSMTDSQNPTAITSKSSTAPQYFSSADGKHKEDETMITEESNNNYQFNEVPTKLTDNYVSSMATTQTPESNNKSTDESKSQTLDVPDTRQDMKEKDLSKSFNQENKNGQYLQRFTADQLRHFQYQSLRGKRKYGDKI